MNDHDAQTPPELFHPDRDAFVLTDILFALSDPARLEIVRQVAGGGVVEMASCHLTNPEVPKSTKSHHMKVLREAGILRNEPAGRGRLLSLRREDLEARFAGLLGAVLGE